MSGQIFNINIYNIHRPKYWHYKIKLMETIVREFKERTQNLPPTTMMYNKMKHLTDKVILKILHHAKRSETLDANYFEQSIVANGKLLILGVIQILLLDYWPDLLNHLMSGHGVLSHKGSQFGGQIKGLCVTASAAFTSSTAALSLLFTGRVVLIGVGVRALLLLGRELAGLGRLGLLGRVLLVGVAVGLFAGVGVVGRLLGLLCGRFLAGGAALLLLIVLGVFLL